MTLYKKITSVDDEKDSIVLFTSLLLRYPEICSLNYYPQENTLKLIFILCGNLQKPLLNKFSDELNISIQAYLFFEKNETPREIIINYDYESELTRVIITRDADTLTQKEISLIIKLLHVHFKKFLFSEEKTIFAEEDLPVQDDYIKDMLENLQPESFKNEIIALREDGRVLIFKQ
ncbi:MAG TPA: hypothetical protein GX532_05200 [Clostridia bacterium]|jgi:hypothetical protein|nr:hypothetical protein [Clostridia bacterium]HHY06356.1 hypothetical protein [Clostridia bacterium]